MTYLLDTHYMIWSVSNPDKLSAAVKKIITDNDNTIVVSVISFWEVSLKNSVGKLNFQGFLPEDIPEACEKIGFKIENLSAIDCSTYHKLTATYHKDPFDRMLIWQAIQRDYTLISSDSNIKKYTSEGLKILSDKRR